MTSDRPYCEHCLATPNNDHLCLKLKTLEPEEKWVPTREGYSKLVCVRCGWESVQLDSLTHPVVGVALGAPIGAFIAFWAAVLSLLVFDVLGGGVEPGTRKEQLALFEAALGGAVGGVTMGLVLSRRLPAHFDAHDGERVRRQHFGS